jgi:hypothetical protein
MQPRNAFPTREAFRLSASRSLAVTLLVRYLPSNDLALSRLSDRGAPSMRSAVVRPAAPMLYMRADGRHRRRNQTGHSVGLSQWHSCCCCVGRVCCPHALGHEVSRVQSHCDRALPETIHNRPLLYELGPGVTPEEEAVIQIIGVRVSCPYVDRGIPGVSSPLGSCCPGVSAMSLLSTLYPR